MAKRFTDTDKWNKKWYRQLGSKLRDVRQFILDNCTHAGVWEVDLETLKHFTGQSVGVCDIEAAFRGEVIRLPGDKIFIPAFIDFQYGPLSEESKPHQSVIKELKKLTLWEEYAKGYPTLKDKEKEKEKDKEGESEGKIETTSADGVTPRDLFALWNQQRGSLPEAEKLSDERIKKAKAQLRKYPDLDHWQRSLRKLATSEFCVNEWRPGIDDWLSESKRLRALEGKYDRKISTENAAPLSAADRAAGEILAAIKTVPDGDIEQMQRRLGDLWPVYRAAGGRSRLGPLKPYEFRQAISAALAQMQSQAGA